MKNLITMLLLIILIGCSSDDSNSNPESQLPPITQTGENTFGCLIDGKLFIPRDGAGTLGGSDKGFMFWGDPTDNLQYNEIEINDYKSERTAKLLIHIQNLHQIGVGTYTINLSNGMSNIDGYNHNYMHCRIFNDETNNYQYYRSFENSGELKITKYQVTNQESQNKIVSGTFSCRLKNSSNPNDIIEVTLGRFDINKSTLYNEIFP